MVSVVKFSTLIYDFIYLGLFYFLSRLGKGLSILFIFSKNQLSLSLIFSISFFVCLFVFHNSLTYTLIFNIWASLNNSVIKESTCNEEDPSSIPGLGRSTGEGICYPLQYSWASLVAQLVKNPCAMQETLVWFLGWEDPLEKGKVTHSSVLAWRVHGAAESQTRLSAFHFLYYFLPQTLGFDILFLVCFKIRLFVIFRSFLFPGIVFCHYKLSS